MSFASGPAVVLVAHFAKALSQTAKYRLPWWGEKPVLAIPPWFF